MPGPAAKPQKLRDLDGNPEHRPRAKKPVPAAGAPTPPEWLGEYARKIWDGLIQSMPPGFYATADALALAGYCQACNMVKCATEEIETHGITIMKGDAKMKNPACTVLSDALAKITTIGTRLGLDPAARASIGINAGGDKPPTAEGFGDLIPIAGGKGAA